MKITYIPSDMDAPGSYRCLFPARQLALRGGHQVALPPYTVEDQEDGRRRFKFAMELQPPTPHADVWVLQQRLERMWSEFGVQKVREAGIATIAEVDDNYLELPSWNPAFYGTHPYVRDDGVIINREQRRRTAKTAGWKKTPPNKANRTHMHDMFRLVDAMTVSTPYLKDLYSAYNKNIHVLRNCVDWDLWKDVTPQYEVKRERPRIGYLGVWRYRQGDLTVIRGVVEPFLHKHPNVDFVANTEEVHDFLGVPQGQRVTIGEYDFFPRNDGDDYPLASMTAVMDIGLVPLAPGGMNEGKSHLKGMEYNAAGIPFISSDTESYRYWTNKGVNGFIASSKKEWADLLEYLVSRDGDRREMGFKGRECAERASIQNNWPLWQDVYEQVVGDEFNTYARGAISRGAVQKVSELSSLLREISRRRPKVVVEIGSARGGTFWALSQVTHDHGHMVTIDIPGGSVIDRYAKSGEDRYGYRDRNVFKQYVKPTQQLSVIDMDSHQQSTLVTLTHALKGRKIDVLFIDGDHTYQGVRQDYEMYSPLVREGGLIAFHDVIVQNDPRAQVHKLWGDLKRKATWTREWVGSDNWGLGNWGGIGVIERR